MAESNQQQQPRYASNGRVIPNRRSAQQPPQSAYRKFVEEDVEAEEYLTPEEQDERFYGQRPRSSARDYRATEEGIVVPRPPQQARPTRTMNRQAPPTRIIHQRSSWPWYGKLFVGLLLFLIICLIGVFAWTWFQAAWKLHTEDVTYGTLRTYHIDQYVNLGDSPAHPDHFIALNLHGQVIVVQLNPLNAKLDNAYHVTTIENATTPVMLQFRDLLNRGKLDMLVIIGPDNDTPFIVNLFNNGTAFQLAQPKS